MWVETVERDRKKRNERQNKRRETKGAEYNRILTPLRIHNKEAGKKKTATPLSFFYVKNDQTR